MMSIAVDWGSSSFRAYLLDEQLQCVDKVSSAKGVFNVKEPFAIVLKNSCASWLQNNTIQRIIMGGMIGSRNGWKETSYSQCPVSAKKHSQLALNVENDLGVRVEILQGVQGLSPSGFVDVMRGEEIQLFGALDNLSSESAMVCLPGTHSKWVHMQSQEICSFATLMTGEMFALIREHSSIGSLVTDTEFHESSFLQGVHDLQNANKIVSTSLLHSLFSVRAKAVSNTLTATSIFSYLSGLIIADEIKNANTLFNLQEKELVVITDDKLKQVYSLALAAYSLNAIFLSSEAAFLNGIRRLIKY